MKLLLLVFSLAACSSMAAETNYCRRVDGVIYNPQYSKLWKTIPEYGNPVNIAIPGFRDYYTVSSVRTNGVIFSVERRSGDNVNDNGYVFVKNIPHKETFYTGQTLDQKLYALPIANMDFPDKTGGKITVRAFDCGEPCPPPKAP